MNPLSLLADSVTKPIYAAVSNAFNNHPKMTAITLLALGIILTVSLILVCMHFGYTPPIELTGIVVAIGGLGLTYGIYLLLNKTGHERAASRVLTVIKVATPILLGAASMLFMGQGVTALLSGNATSLMTTVLLVGGAAAGAGAIHETGTALHYIDALRKKRRDSIRSQKRNMEIEKARTEIKKKVAERRKVDG